MRERLLLLIPVAGVTCLLVLFVVCWQAIQDQNNRLQSLTNRLKELEQREEVNSRQLLEQQLSVLKTRQQKLHTDIQSLQRWQRDTAQREARLLDILRRGDALPRTQDEGSSEESTLPNAVRMDPSAPTP